MAFEPLESSDPVEVGPYRLLARLGAGGMGRVYLARSAGGRTVAVKVVRAELAEDADFRERFRREVSAAQAVDGAYTAPVVDADRDGPNPWLATAYVLGPSLTEAVAAHGPLPTSAVRALGTGLAQALNAIHHAGMVHRDLKPSNVLLAADGPRVIDFGIARALEGDRLTSTGVVVGSPGFMCPEQAAGQRMGPAGDVFSLGSVLVYAATGQGPFAGGEDGPGSAATQLYRVIHDEPDLSRLPAELRPAIMACLSKDPADRPTPTELAGLLGGQESLARGGWLPAPVSSDIATHAASVMDMETPARGSAAVSGDPRLAQGAQVTGGPATAFDRPEGTMRLGGGPAQPEGTMRLGGGTAPEGPQGPAATPASRRGLLIGGGAAVVAALGGGAAWLLMKGDKPKPKPNPVPPNGSPSPSPLATKSHAPGTAPGTLWEYRIAGSTFSDSRLAFGPGVVFLGGQDLIALGLDDGKERYTKQNAGAYNMAAYNGTLSWGSIGDISMIDVASGTLLWKFSAPSPKPGDKEQLFGGEVLAADDRAVYTMCSFEPLDASGSTVDGAKAVPGMMALNRKDGTVLWTQHRAPNAQTDVASALTKDIIAYTNSQKELIARAVSDGHQSWVANTNSMASYQPVSDGDRIFCSADSNGIQAVGTSDGKQIWTKPGDHSKSVWYSPAAVADGVVYTVFGGQTITFGGDKYVPGAPSYALALKATDGTELWRVELPSETLMDLNPVLVQNTLFIATGEKGIFAVDIKNHKLRWTFQNGAVNPLPWLLGTDGQRLLALQGNQLYCLPPE